MTGKQVLIYPPEIILLYHNSQTKGFGGRQEVQAEELGSRGALALIPTAIGVTDGAVLVLAETLVMTLIVAAAASQR